MSEFGDALKGLKVIEIANFMSGPMIGLMLADFGADVVKIEKIEGGDDARVLPPTIDGLGSFYAQLGRNKRSVAVNLKHPTGVALVSDLLATADIVIDNYRSGALKRAGLDYDAVRARNPGLIECKVTGFGEGNAYSDRAAYDPILQGMSGLMLMTGFDGDPPVRAGSPVVDLVTSLLGTIGLLVALNERERTGLGQRVDVSLLGAAATIMSSSIFAYWAKGELMPRASRDGNGFNLVPIVETADGEKVQLALGNYGIIQRLCIACGIPEVTGDPRFASMPLLSQNIDEFGPLIREAFAKEDLAHWDKTLSQHGIPWGPIYNVAQFFDDSVVREMLISSVRRASGATIPTVRTAVDFSRSTLAALAPPVELGENTDEVLGERLGMASADLVNLREQGIIR